MKQTNKEKEIEDRIIGIENQLNNLYKELHIPYVMKFTNRDLELINKGKTQTLEKVKEKIEKLEKDFESRLDENNKPDIVNSQVNGVLLGLSFVKNFLNDKEEI